MFSGEFVLYVGINIALNAIAIDVMLPALPQMSGTFGLSDPAKMQAIIAACMLGMGLSQLIWGPLADRFGRRPVLITGLSIFLLASLITVVTANFTTMLVARFFQGIGTGATRVIAVSSARDSYEGNQLGRVMAHATFVWVSMPVLAPFLGQAILLFAHWRWIFIAMLIIGLVLMLWTVTRFKEPLLPANRRKISPLEIWRSYKIVLTTRASVFYLLAMGMLFGPHLGFVISSPKVYMDVFGQVDNFAWLFALTGSPMAIAAVINSKLVMRFGMKNLVTVGLSALFLQNSIHYLLILLGYESLALFVVVQMANMFAFGFVTSSISALAMQPLGHVAGTASSLMGFFPVVCGAIFGSLMGQSVDQSVAPVALIYLVMGGISLLLTRFVVSNAKASNQ